MNAEQLRLVIAGCLITVSAAFCVLGTIKVANDRVIAVGTNRVADALERAHPEPLELRTVESSACR